jgi:hypothetical protein
MYEQERNRTIVPAERRVAQRHKRRRVKLLKRKGKIFELADALAVLRVVIGWSSVVDK